MAFSTIDVSRIDDVKYISCSSDDLMPLISSDSIYYAPESDLRVKSNEHLNFSRAFVVQFRASRYIMGLNLNSVSNVMIIWISREHPLCNSERLDVLRA